MGKPKDRESYAIMSEQHVLLDYAFAVNDDFNLRLKLFVNETENQKSYLWVYDLIDELKALCERH